MFRPYSQRLNLAHGRPGDIPDEMEAAPGRPHDLGVPAVRHTKAVPITRANLRRDSLSLEVSSIQITRDSIPIEVPEKKSKVVREVREPSWKTVDGTDIPIAEVTSVDLEAGRRRSTEI